MDLELLKSRLLKSRLIAAVIITVTVISVVFLSTRGIAQPITQSCTESASIYMKISGIDGEADVGDITGQIEVVRFSQGVYNPMIGELVRADTAIMQPITITKLVDKVTPKLYEKSIKKEVLTSVTLRFYRYCPYSESVLYYQIELTNSQIVSVRSYHTGTPETLPMDEVAFKFEEITWTWFSDQGKVEATYKIVDR